MAQFIYRLRLLLEQKEEAKNEADRELARREQELAKQVEHLESLKRREKELLEKRERLRRELLAKPAGQETLTARAVLDRSEFVKVVGLQIEEARNDIASQRSVIEQCELRVGEAKRSVEEAKREVEILTKHRAKQEERFLREERAREELELDEIGNVSYANRRQPS